MNEIKEDLNILELEGFEFFACNNSIDFTKFL